MAFAAQNFFTTPVRPASGRSPRRRKDGRDVVEGVPDDVVARSEAHGKAVAEHILAWSHDRWRRRRRQYGLPAGIYADGRPCHWVPTSLIAQQQFPLLPDWGNNRTFAMPTGATCPLPPPPEYSEETDSDFYKEGIEVYETVKHAHSRTARHRAVLVGRSDAVADTSRPLDIDRPAGAGKGTCRV